MTLTTLNLTLADSHDAVALLLFMSLFRYVALAFCRSLEPLRFHSFIHSGYFYSASSSPLLLRGAPDTARILCRNFTPKRHRQL